MRTIAKRIVTVVAGLVVAIFTSPVQAGPIQVIDDRSFFDNFQHTLIDFETRGNGAPLLLNEGAVYTTLPTEYQSQGIVITTSGSLPDRLLISNGLNAHSDAAEAIAASPKNHLSPPGPDTWLHFTLSKPTHAFGLTVLNSSEGSPVVLNAYDANDALITSVLFTGHLIDGTVPGAPFGNTFDIQYGFMGVFSPGNMISRISIQEDISIFDDVHFAVVPEPATVLLVAIAVLAVSLRLRNLKCASVQLATHASNATLLFFALAAIEAYAQSTIVGGVAWPSAAS